MSFNYGWRGPNIVKDGLKLYTDAGSPNSFYNKTGTIWKDISGNGNNGTLINGPTFDSNNGGSIVFDGTNDYVNVGNLGTFYPQGTINFWIKSTAVQDYRNPFSTHYLGVNAGIRFEQYTNPSPYGGFNVLIGNDNGSQYTLYDYSPGAALTQNIWYYVTLVWNTQTSRAIGYLNSTEKFNTSHTYWPTTIPSVSIGSGFDSSRYFKGNISQVLIYKNNISHRELE
jgi:hypothetical protein